MSKIGQSANLRKLQLTTVPYQNEHFNFKKQKSELFKICSVIQNFMKVKMLSNMHSMDIVAKNTIFVAPSKSCLVSGSSVGYHLCLQCRIPTVQYVQSVLDTHSAEHFSKFGCSNSLMLLTHRSQNFLISSERCEEPSTENILLELEQHKLVDSCCSVTNRQLSCAADTTPPHALQHTVLRMRWDGTGSDRTRGYGYEVNIGTCHMLQMQRRIFDL